MATACPSVGSTHGGPPQVDANGDALLGGSDQGKRNRLPNGGRPWVREPHQHQHQHQHHHQQRYHQQMGPGTMPDFDWSGHGQYDPPPLKLDSRQGPSGPPLRPPGMGSYGLPPTANNTMNISNISTHSTHSTHSAQSLDNSSHSASSHGRRRRRRDREGTHSRGGKILPPGGTEEIWVAWPN